MSRASQLSVLFAFVLLTAPVALAHGEAPPPGEPEKLVPLAAPVGSLGAAARSGAVSLAAGQTTDDELIFQGALPTSGWLLVAVREPGARQSATHGGASDLHFYEVVGAHVGSSGSATVATGTLLHSQSAGGAHGSHDAGEWFLAMEATPNPAARAEAEPDGHGGFVVTLALPSDAARLEPGTVVEMLAFRGEGAAMPTTPFLTSLEHEAGSFRVYVARAGETPAEAALAARALLREPDPWPSIAAAGLAALAVGLGAFAARGLREPVPAKARAVSGVFVFDGTFGRAQLSSLALAALLVVPLFAPAAAAASEDPDDFLGPLLMAGAPRDPCAEGAPVREYNVSAIDMDIVYNRWGDHDPQGMMYVLDEELPAVLEEKSELDERLADGSFPTGAEKSLITPLVLRVRLGECLVIHFTNRLGADPADPGPHPLDPMFPGNIDILEHQFVPGTLTVVAGEPVSWTNLDPLPHVVTFLNSSFSTGPLEHDIPFTHVFTTPGTYQYVCDGAVDMPGTLVVLPVGSTPPASQDPTPAAACGTPPPPPPRPATPDALRQASVHVHGLGSNPLADGAGAVGRNPLSTVPPGGARDYRVSATAEGIYLFHDHGDPTSVGIDAFASLTTRFIGSNTHGLFGAVVVEPAGATWTDQATGEPLRSGWRADVHAPGMKSFREFVIFYHDPQLEGRNHTEILEPKADHGLNYRVETFSHRLNDDLDRCPLGSEGSNNGINPCQDVSLLYASNVHGDPGTPMPRAYMGDDVKFRIVHAGMEEAHVHHLHNHRWKAVEGDANSTTIDSQTLSPGEGFTQSLEAGAGGESRPGSPGDSVFHCHLFPHLYGGMWSLFRVHDRLEPDLRPLPDEASVAEPTDEYPGFPSVMMSQSSGHRSWRPPQEAGLDNRTGLVAPAPGAPYSDPCPAGAPMRRYHLTAIETRADLNGRGDFDPVARVYAFLEDAVDIMAGHRNPEPVVLRANAGECIEVKLENWFPFNATTSDATQILGFGKVSIHPHLHEFDVLGSDGVTTGWNFDQTIWPGENITYRYWADSELQTIVWHDHAAGLETAFRGIYGATIIEPEGTDWRDPVTGRPIYTKGYNEDDGAYDSVYDVETARYADTWRADIVGPNIKDFREFFASIQDFLPAMRENGTFYRPQAAPLVFDDFGLMGFNYRSEPLWHRTDAGMENVFNSSLYGDPSTNLWEAYAGDPVVVRFHQVAYEEAHTLTIDGHRWRAGYKDPTSPLTDSFTIGVSEAFNAYIECGAGGCARSAGDYLYRGGSTDDLWAGAWGIFRVHGEPKPALRPLDDRPVEAVPAKVCPPGAPMRYIGVTAIETELLYNTYGDHDPNGLAYVLDHEVSRIESGQKRPEPLVLRVGQAECLKIRLTNAIPPDRVPHAHSDPSPTGGWVAPRLGHWATTGELLSVRPYEPGDRVGLHAHLLTHDAQRSYGGRVGLNADSTVAYNESRTYTFYTDVPVGTVALLEDLGDLVSNRHHGLFGAIVVDEPGSYAVNPKTGMPDPNLAVADIVSPGGDHRRDAVLFHQSGVPLFQASGRPVPLREAHGGFVQPADAARLTLEALDVLVDKGDDRAVVTLVEPAAPGFLVHGTLEGRPFRAHVGIEGTLHGVAFLPEGGEWPAERSVRLLGPSAEPVPAVAVMLERPGLDVGGATGSDGVANFSATLLPDSLATVRFVKSNCTIPVRAGFDGEFRLEVRSAPEALADASLAASLALAYLKDHKLPAGPVGISAVDVTGRIWRVTAEDALRVYQIEIEPVTRHVQDFSFEARATPAGLPAYLPQRDVERAAERFLETHYGDAPTDPSAMRLDRFGAWRVEYDGDGVATSLRVDGQTGRILAFVRGPAQAPTPGAPYNEGQVALRVRLEGGANPAGAVVMIVEDGLVVGETTLREGGRAVIPYAALARSDSPGAARIEAPSLDIGFPIDIQDGRVEIDIADATPGSLVKMGLAIEAAARWLDGFVELDREPEPWGVTGIDLAADGAWHVRFATGEKGAVRLEVLVDSYTGRVVGASMLPWDNPKDHCSNEIQEHLGPHPSPKCGSSFSVADEEDQGLKAFNYRAEPYENRLVREPDPSLVYSSIVHRDPSTPMLRAYSNDPVTIHLVGVQDKGRAGAFSVAGHLWPAEPDDPQGPMASAQGGMGAYRVHRLELVGGAGGQKGLDGDYLYQGSIQRFGTEAGEWGIVRVYSNLTPSLRQLSDPVPMPAPPAGAGTGCNHPSTRVVDAVYEATEGGAPTLTARFVGELVVRAGETTEVRLRLVDAAGRPIPSGLLHVGGATRWATGEAHAADVACVVLSPPGEAAGQTSSLRLAASVDGHEVVAPLVFSVGGPAAAGSAPGGGSGVGENPDGPDAGAEVPTPSLSALLAAVAAACVLMGARRRRD